MITHLRGKLVEKNPTYVIIECGGVGYFLNISLHTYDKLPKDEHIFMLTYLQVREDAHTLYGFMEAAERSLFTKLISVSGIGASTARTMLSALSPEQIVAAITTENVAEIKSVKGIGLKTAQRVIIDLKDKLTDLQETSETLIPRDNIEREEALSALETLGYKRNQTTKLVRQIVTENPEATVEYIIKQALKKL